MSNLIHDPVMLKEVLDYLSPQDHKVYVDGTFGAGGYTRAILKKANCKVYAIDRDPRVVTIADNLSKEFPGRLKLLKGCFADVKNLLNNEGIDKVDGFVLDVGVSSMQIDEAERGFSFKQDGPLDMRMSGHGISAADIVNTMEEKQLADLIYNLGDERKSRQIARAIVNERSKQKITTTKQLADIVRLVVRMKNHQIDPATRTFQALRIFVNDELNQLTKALEASEFILNKQGRIVVVSFHSLEDNIVKKFFKLKSGQLDGVSRHIPIANENNKEAKIFSLLTKKVVVASNEEVSRNIRSRSAHLRAAIKE